MKKVRFKSKFLLTTLFSLIIFLCLFTSQVKATEGNNDEILYLSDIDYIANQSRTGWGSILKDKASDNNKISVKVEGAYYTFEKGMWAHATSTLVYDISSYKNDYDYFVTYMGLNSSAASSSNGVKFYVYTSVDGKDYKLATEENAPISKPGENARYLKLSIKDVNYLKLVANDNGSNGNDHSVYADAKFVKQSYLDEQAKLVVSLEEYDKKIKNYPNKDVSDKGYELLLLQREFASNLGQYALQRFINESPDNKDTIDWLMSDIENLRYYILGGTPTGGHFNALKQLTRLLKEYKSDFDITDPISEEGIRRLHNRIPDAPITKGNLYKRMAITLSLTHSTSIGLWMHAGRAENQSDAVVRYKQYKDMYDTGHFKATDAVNITPWFESYSIEEMRYVLDANLDDEEVLWLNEYTQSKIDAAPGNAWNLLTPHPYMAYVWPDYTNKLYYDDANYEYFNNLFGVPLKDANGNKVTDENGNVVMKLMWPDLKDPNVPNYGISRGSLPNNVISKLWMNFRNKFETGAVCGGISKTGACIRSVHGIPSAVIGQPGHAAIVYYTQDVNGKGYWGIDNDVSGWTQSEKGERMPLGWGNASYSRGYSVVYMALSQEAINDQANLEKCQKIMMEAKVYAGDLVKQEKIYREALKVQPINIDAWYGLITTYNANPAKGPDEYIALADEMAEALKYFPLPMYHLTNLIKPKLTSVEHSYQFALLQARILNEGKSVPNNTATSYTVYQPSITRTMANYLLGSMDTTMATFSFDGEDANKIVLSSRFDGNGVRWDYCIDGNPTGGLSHWHEVSFSGEEEHKRLLTPEEIASITAENDIYIHIVGVNYEEKNLYKIDILESQGLPSTLYANDLENKLIAATPVIKWKLNENDPWKLYKDEVPDLSGDKTIIVKAGATGVYLEGKTETTFNFTANTDPDERRYISVDHITLNSFSTEASAQGRYARNAIDANLNTSWHSNWNGNDPNKFIVFEFDTVKNLTALEFFPLPGGNGKIESAQILVSIDGQNWTEVVSGTNWTYKNTDDISTKSVDFEPAKAKFVKIIGKRTQNSFIAAKMFNLYENVAVQIVGNFSFDGANAGKIVMDDEVKGTKWKYSIDGGASWKDGSGDEHQLTLAEINQLNAEDQIKIRLGDEEKVHTITIKKMAAPTISAYLNDWENRLIGITNTDALEWKIKSNARSASGWKDYSAEEPVVAGNNTLLIRTKAAGIFAPSETIEFEFTENNTAKATYIPVSHLSITDKSSETVRPGNQEHATNAIDAKISTMWHTSRVATNDLRYIVIKLDEPKYISRLQYIRTAGYAYGVLRNGVISTSMDGENWEEAVVIKDLYAPANKAELLADTNIKDIDFPESKEAQYIKLQCTKACDYVNTADADYFLAAAMLNLYEDTTKDEKVVVPTAEVEYSTMELTNQDVTATLINESTEITVTNNEGSKTHTFTENDEFTFEFVDSKGTKGTATATVSNIDKVAPTATISYNITELTDENVVATLEGESEEIIITNNEGQRTHTFTENGKFTFTFKDKAGNIGTAEANVYWIMTEDQKYDEIKAEIIKIIEDYKKKATEEEITHKLTNQKEKALVIESYERLRDEDKAPYTTFIDRLNKGGTPVITINSTIIDKTYRVKEGTEMNVYDFITIRDNEDGVIVSNEDNVKVTTDLDTSVPGTYIVSYEVKDSDNNVSKEEIKVIVADEVIPTAKIKYSTTELTNQNVIATLVDHSERIIITNNSGSDIYTFTKNGEFIFKFVDQEGNEGSTTATVNWIDKEAPVAMVDYDVTKKTEGPVVAKLVMMSEEIKVTNNDGKTSRTFTENGSFTFEFVDKAGNKGTTTAEVTWIKTAEEKYQELKAEIVKKITDYQAKATTEELNNKKVNADEKALIIEAYNQLREEDKAPYTEFINKVKAGGKPVITQVSSEAIKYDEGDIVDVYSLIKIRDNEDGEIAVNKDNVKVTTDLDTEKAGIYDVIYEITDSDGNKSTLKLQVEIKENNNPRFRMVLESAETKLKPGDKFDIVVKATNIKNIKDGLIALAGTMDYDNKILEIDSITGENDWVFNEDSFNDNNLKFVTDNSKYILNDGAVFRISLIVKEDLDIEKSIKTVFRLTGIEASNGEYRIRAKDAEITLEIEAAEKDPFSIKSDKYDIQENVIRYVLPETTVTKFYSQITANRNLHVVDKSGTEQTEDTLVKTGMKLTVEDEDLEYTIVVLGDINEDGKMDITDLAKLKLHLIDLITLKDINLTAADINKNGEVDINDIAKMKLVLIDIATIE